MIPKRNKYGAKKTEYNGYTFDSKAEARFAAKLDMSQRAGLVSYWLAQVPIRLPGKTVYRVDFQVFYPDGSVKYFDVKGFVTPTFRMKKRMVEELYPVEIQVVK